MHLVAVAVAENFLLNMQSSFYGWVAKIFGHHKQ